MRGSELQGRCVRCPAASLGQGDGGHTPAQPPHPYLHPAQAPRAARCLWRRAPACAVRRRCTRQSAVLPLLPFASGAVVSGNAGTCVYMQLCLLNPCAAAMFVMLPCNLGIRERMPVKSRLIPCLFVAWQAPHTTAMCTAGRAAAQVSGPPRMASRLATLLQQPRLRCRLAGRQRPPGLRAPPRATAQQRVSPGHQGMQKATLHGAGTWARTMRPCRPRPPRLLPRRWRPRQPWRRPGRRAPPSRGSGGGSSRPEQQGGAPPGLRVYRTAWLSGRRMRQRQASGAPLQLLSLAAAMRGTWALRRLRRQARPGRQK